MKKLVIFIIIVCTAWIIISSKGNINLYNKLPVNQLQYKNSAYVELQNPSFELDSFDDAKMDK